MPFNRFLAWQLYEMQAVKYERLKVCQVTFEKPAAAGERYRVDFAPRGQACDRGSQRRDMYHDVIIRYGTEKVRPLERDFPEVHRAMKKAEETGRPPMKGVLCEEAFDLFWAVRPSPPRTRTSS